MSDRVQKMARINVTDDAWTALRIQALREHTTIADRIGELIERAVADAGAAAHDPTPEPDPPPKRSGFPLLKPLPQRDSSPGTPAPEAQWIPPWEE